MTPSGIDLFLRATRGPGRPLWLSVLCDPDRRKAHGIAARGRVLERFMLDAMVRKYERLYCPEGLTAKAYP